MASDQEISTYTGGGREVAPAPSPGIPVEQRMMMLREALTNPDVDPAKAVAMADLMFKLEDRDRQAEFNRDKIAAKRAMPAIFKRGLNTHQGTRYAKFEDMQRAVDPVLERHRLSIDFKVGNEGREITVIPVLRHENGWIEEGERMKGPADEGKGRSAIQAVGSASSYLKRYAMVAMLNLVIDGEDNDGAIAHPDYQLNDRQELLVINAQAAADGGSYPDFFSKLDAKDRAFLIQSGNHGRMGGTVNPALSDGRKPAPQPEGAAQKTPEEMADAWITAVNSIDDLDALRDYQTLPARADWLAKLKAKRPDLADRIIEANSRRAAALQPKDEDIDEGDDTFPEAQV